MNEVLILMDKKYIFDFEEKKKDISNEENIVYCSENKISSRLL